MSQFSFDKQPGNPLEDAIFSNSPTTDPLASSIYTGTQELFEAASFVPLEALGIEPLKPSRKKEDLYIPEILLSPATLTVLRLHDFCSATLGDEKKPSLLQKAAMACIQVLPESWVEKARVIGAGIEERIRPAREFLADQQARLRQYLSDRVVELELREFLDSLNNNLSQFKNWLNDSAESLAASIRRSIKSSEENQAQYSKKLRGQEENAGLYLASSLPEIARAFHSQMELLLRLSHAEKQDEQASSSGDMLRKTSLVLLELGRAVAETSEKASQKELELAAHELNGAMETVEYLQVLHPEISTELYELVRLSEYFPSYGVPNEPELAALAERLLDQREMAHAA
ncbi:MAG: hypothetical protein KDD42_00350 [Bdellovibrionales bacterium]|nr:hypothetical protein [Bdellovibrionales bacterium]